MPRAVRLEAFSTTTPVEAAQEREAARTARKGSSRGVSFNK